MTEMETEAKPVAQQALAALHHHPVQENHHPRNNASRVRAATKHLESGNLFYATREDAKDTAPISILRWSLIDATTVD